MLVSENNAGMLLENNAGEFMTLAWKPGERADAEVKEMFQRTIKQTLARHWKKLLVDQTLMQAASPEVEYWFLYEWMPQVKLSFPQGFCAIVGSRELLARLATISMLRDVQAELGFPVRLFDNVAVATEWLNECQHLPADRLQQTFVNQS